MKAVWMGVIATAALLLAGTAQANQALAKEKGCMACHAMDAKTVGPGYKEVAAKYKGDKGAEANLSEKVRKGGVGVWGQFVPMPAHDKDKVTDADIKTLVKWILSIK